MTCSLPLLLHNVPVTTGVLHLPSTPPCSLIQCSSHWESLREARESKSQSSWACRIKALWKATPSPYVNKTPQCFVETIKTKSSISIISDKQYQANTFLVNELVFSFLSCAVCASGLQHHLSIGKEPWMRGTASENQRRELETTSMNLMTNKIRGVL